MKETPLLFSQEMMTAIRAGRKTQTRRTMREPWKIRLPEPVHGDWPFDAVRAPAGVYEACHNPLGAVSVKTAKGEMLGVKPDEFEWITPYGGPGDLIWCKEKWRVVGWDFDDGTTQIQYGDGEKRWMAPAWGDLTISDEERWTKWQIAQSEKIAALPGVRFDENDGECGRYQWDNDDVIPWRSARFMPKWVARTWLTVESIRPQRLQAIDEADAKAEGVLTSLRARLLGVADMDATPLNGAPSGLPTPSYRNSFATLWDRLHAGDNKHWAMAPWVWRIAFAIADRGRAE